MIKHSLLGPIAAVFFAIVHSGLADEPPAAVPLLPGAHCFDVTQPPYLAVPDDDTDDTLAIQRALNDAAAAAAAAGNLKTAQQIVYLPTGTYWLSDTLVFPKNFSPKRSPIEACQWLCGAGMGRTIIRLRSAAASRRLGAPDAPRPVVQVAEYRFDNKAGGNINFQLWVTDLSIVVPADQPHAVGLSYGSANMGAVRRVEIRAEGAGGHTGLALVQYNNGPGFIEHVRVTGFHTGVEINDNWGESFTLSNLSIERQKPGGVGLSVSDKLIAVEGLRVLQDQPDVTAILLHDGKGKNSLCGGAPHLSLLDAHITHTASGGARVPAIDIRVGHVYLRHIAVDGYGTDFLRDHGRARIFDRGRIDDEFVSVHGHTIGEKKNVAVTTPGAPARTLQLPLKKTPEIPVEAWQALEQKDYTLLNAAALQTGKVQVSTAWVIVDPRGAKDGATLLQAALDSGARYVGLLNDDAFRVGRTLFVNRPGTPQRVELIFGLISEILVANSLAMRQPPYDEVNEGLLFRLETGQRRHLHIKGLRIRPDGWHASDFTLFQNESAGTVVFEDVRAKTGPRHYRNSPAAAGSDIFIENVEWAYNDAFPQDNVIFSGQRVWARNFNVEMNILPEPVTINVPGTGTRTFSRFSTKRKIINDGGTLWSCGQKVGEYNGPFFETRNGGQTELIAVFMNQATQLTAFAPTSDAACLVVADSRSALSFVGQERPRGPKNAPHANTFARIESPQGRHTIPATLFPTYLTYDGYDPFQDTDPTRYFEQNTFRVFGLFRCEIVRSE